ncbi:MAG: oligosaccharide flippase family protein [Planctomycetota bacterium]
MSLARNTIFLTVGKLLGTSIYILFGLVLPGFVDTDQNGVYTLMATMLTFGGMMSSFGIPVIVTREVARSQERAAKIFADARLAMGLGAMVSAILITAFLYGESLYSGEPMGQMWILLLLVLGIMASDALGYLAESLFHGFEKMASPAVVEAVTGLVRAGGAALSLFLLPQDYRLFGIFGMFLFGSAIRAWLLSGWVHKRLLVDQQIPSTSLKDAWRMLRSSGFVAVFRLMQMLRNRSDILLMGFLWVSLIPDVVGDVQAARGLYGQALRVAALFLTFTVAFNTALFPRLARLTGGDPANLTSDRAATHDLYGRALRWQAFWVVPLAAGIFFYAETLTGWFGEEYLNGDPENGVLHSTTEVLRILLIAMVADCVSGPAGMLMLGVKELERRVPLVGVISLMVSIVSNVILIPKYGILGAAWAAAITTCLEFILKMTLIGLGYGNPIRILLRTLPYYAVAGAMFWLLFTFDLQDRLLIGVPLGAGFYLIACFLLKLVDPAVLAIVHRRLGKG